MKDLIFKNFILGLILGIGLFVGLNIKSYASSNHVYGYFNHSVNTYNANITFTNGNVNNASNTSGYFLTTTVNGSLDFHTIDTYDGMGFLSTDKFTVNVMLQTSEGNFTVASLTPNPNVIHANDTVLSFNGTYNGSYKKMYLKVSFTQSSNHAYPIYYHIDANYTEHSYLDDIIDSNNSFMQRVYYDNNYDFDHNHYYQYVGNNNIDLTINHIPDNDIVVNTYVTLHNGETMLFDSMAFSRSSLLSNSTVRLRRVSGTFISPIFRVFICVNGVESVNDFTINFDSGSSYTYSITTVLYPSLNVIDTRESSDWVDIGNLPQVDYLGDTSGEVGDIIGDIDDFESSAFTGLDQNLTDAGYDQILLNIPVVAELRFATNCITSFYGALPQSITWLINFVMAIGITMMLLTVGTFALKKSGDAIEARDREYKYSVSKEMHRIAKGK